MSEVRFGSYRVVETLGSGGLSTIYKAIQEPLGRTVALKALKSQMAPTSSFGEQLDREAQILATMAHPNVVLLLDHARAPSGRPYLVLEHVDGLSVAQLLAKRKRLSIEAALAIGAAICAALEHAHERGVVHRDVKPSNVLVARTGVVKLIDFGIAQRERSPSITELAEGVTPSGRLGPEPVKDAFGTPAYMSPEQVLGDFVDGRSDLYSLGVVLYEMTSGTKPFDASETPAARTNDAPRAKDPLGRSSRPPPVRSASSRPPPVRPVSQPAPPRTQRQRRDVVALRERAPEMPRVVERVVMRLLEKSPAERYPTAAAVRERLESALRALTRDDPQAILRAELAEAGGARKTVPGLPISDRVERGTFAPAWRALAGHAAILAMFGASVLAFEGTSCNVRASADDESAALGRARAQGGLRVVASPWAHVRVDGVEVETTPFARAIPLAAGRHWVTLTHPDSAPVDREVVVETGNVVTLDVTMPMNDERDAGKDAR